MLFDSSRLSHVSLAGNTSQKHAFQVYTKSLNMYFEIRAEILHASWSETIAPFVDILSAN